MLEAASSPEAKVSKHPMRAATDLHQRHCRRSSRLASSKVEGRMTCAQCSLPMLSAQLVDIGLSLAITKALGSRKMRSCLAFL